ncbi:1962_t:CDS:1 [Paraglomus brasilianum]|uniref:1962_t:CDS:1 n=1 Tax=Paraglomus brasilianum TaxID=144538 RepID=A0A9N9DGV3_9GLOM|nr:1962_t:CDS:1 [Paraglomus brasilianum]
MATASQNNFFISDSTDSILGNRNEILVVKKLLVKCDKCLKARALSCPLFLIAKNFMISSKLKPDLYGNVHHTEGRPVALKVFDASKKDAILRDGIELPKEAAIFQKILPHPNIIELIYCHRINSTDHWTLAFEYHGYNALKSNLNDYLRDLSNERGMYGLMECEAKNIMYQLLQACRHLEKHGIYHRKLELDNIVINGEGRVKLINFDSAIKVNENDWHCEPPIGSSK